MSQQPSFAALYRQSRYSRADDDPQQATRQNRRELFAVASVAFVMKHDPAFRQVFLKQVFLVENNSLAATFLVLQTAHRQRGCRKTNARTIHDKLKGIHTDVTFGDVNGILRVYEKLSLGTIGEHYGRPLIIWNPTVDLFAIGEAIKARIASNSPVSADGVTSVQPNFSASTAEPKVVCKLPAASFRMLSDTGIAACLGLELVA